MNNCTFSREQRTGYKSAMLSGSIEMALDFAGKHPQDFTLQYPPRRQFFQESYSVEAPVPSLSHLEELLLYIHIPFCRHRCAYCNFATDNRDDQKLHERYTPAIEASLILLEKLLHSSCHISGIDIGGGTPTRLRQDLLIRILQALNKWSNFNQINALSIEASQVDAASDPELLKAIANNGVGRISLGVQTTSAKRLRRLGRVGGSDTLTKAYSNVRSAGFPRANADLIFCLPGQSLADWQEDLDCVLDMGFDSITTYDCLYRGDDRKIQSSNCALPLPEDYGRFYDEAFERLRLAGYHATYGSVNFSKWPEETGTSQYFEGRLLKGKPYIGIGNYASSMINDLWWFAPHGVDDWINATEKEKTLPTSNFYRLPLQERMAKYILLTLNFGFIDCKRFLTLFGLPFESAYARSIEIALSRNWLTEGGGRFAVAEGKFDKMPEIRALFYSPEAIQWLSRNVYLRTS